MTPQEQTSLGIILFGLWHGWGWFLIGATGVGYLFEHEFIDSGVGTLDIGVKGGS